MLDLNKVHHGNCIELLKSMPDKSVNLILTDPPYGIGLEYDNYDDSEENWIKLMTDFIPEAARVAKMVIMPSCKIKMLKWIYQNFPPDWLICWYKGSTGHASFIGFNDWEPHLVYGRTKNRLYMHDYFKTVSSPPKGSFEHPCPKPEEWASWIIKRATEEGDIVCDPFTGSGTTGVVCKKLNRKFIGIEWSQKYVDIAEKRITEAVIPPTAKAVGILTDFL